METDPGTRFGRYELLEQIGAGGMGQVVRPATTGSPCIVMEYVDGETMRCVL